MDQVAQSYFNKAQRGCVSEALQYLKGFTKEDIKNFVDSTYKVAAEQKLNLEDAVKYQMEEQGKIFKNRAALQKQTYELLFNPKTGWYNQITDKKLHINDILVNDTDKSKGINVENFQKSTQANNSRAWFDDISKAAQDYLLSKLKDIDMYKGLDGIKTGDPLIDELVKSLQGLHDDVQADLIDSGALPLEDQRSDFKFGINYHPMKVAQRPSILKKGQAMFQRIAKGEKIVSKSLDDAKQNFIDFMKSKANLLQMFGKNAQDDDVIKEAFGNMFDSIMLGAKVNKDLGISIKSEADVRKKQTQFFVPKDWQSYGDVLAKYGKNNSLMEQVFDYIHQSGAQIGLARVLGSDPYWSFDKLLTAEQKTYGTEPKAYRPTHVFAELTGYTAQPVDPTLAALGSNFRAYTGMVKQAALQVSSLNDTNLGLQVISQMSTNSYMQNFLTKVKTIGDVYKGQLTGEMPEHITRILGNLSQSIKYEIGALARYSEAMNMGDITRKVTSKFYTWTGMHGKDMGNIAGANYIVTKDFGDHRNVSYADLPAPLQNHLRSFDISQTEWEVARTYIDKNDYQEKLFTPDVLDNMTNEDADRLAHEIGNQRLAQVDTAGMDEDQINSLRASLNPGAMQAKAELLTKIYSMLETAAHETILYPGALQRAFMNRGTKAGTIEGELYRSLFQFKGFLLSYINRILINGFKQDPSKAKLNWALTNFVYTLPLNYMSNVLYNAATGRPLKADPFEWNAEDMIENLVPGFGIFAKCMSPNQQNHGLAMSTLLQTPTISDLSDLMGLAGSTVNLAQPSKGTLQQRAKNFGHKAAQTISDFTPINSTPLASQWFRNNFINSGGR